jgi:TolA-binding protein
LDEGKIEDAIKIFQLFVLEYPEISNSYDSLGEAFAKNKNYKEALYNYRKALKINPDSQSAARAIERLEKLQEKDLKKFPE